MELPPLPWRHRVRVRPQSDPLRPRLRFQLGQAAVLRVAPEPPRIACTDQFVIQAPTVGQIDLSQGSTKSILPKPTDRHLVVQGQLRSELSCFPSEGLASLRRIDPVQSDRHGMAIQQDGDGIAVSHPDDLAPEVLSARSIDAQQRQRHREGCDRDPAEAEPSRSHDCQCIHFWTLAIGQISPSGRSQMHPTRRKVRDASMSPAKRAAPRLAADRAAFRERDRRHGRRVAPRPRSRCGRDQAGVSR